MNVRSFCYRPTSTTFGLLSLFILGHFHFIFESLILFLHSVQPIQWDFYFSALKLPFDSSIPLLRLFSCFKHVHNFSLKVFLKCLDGCFNILAGNSNISVISVLVSVLSSHSGWDFPHSWYDSWTFCTGHLGETLDLISICSSRPSSLASHRGAKWRHFYCLTTARWRWRFRLTT